ncbi:hypothetical protein [Thermochromatium tepidum]|uniref:Uncharacterized protein n=1 Tax=Thermochromatium tepidum ATCC 43061 TaxID=316276 RepID=A0A6I6EBH0_THETI|nr:hypothetical protein [Thermochromatium tepidum]QGU32289.1 hypothetical protein E6P07_04360 [Thermochromatium tepidum ATCC 43061]
MSDSEEKKPSRSGLGWFPKLILWAAVIGFGYVYLSSVDRESGTITASSMLDSIAKLNPVPLSSLPGFSGKEEPAAELSKTDQTENTASKTEAPAKPVAQTEGTAKPTTSTETPKAVEASRPAPQPPVSYASVALKAPAEPAPAPAAPATTEKPAPTAPGAATTEKPAAPAVVATEKPAPAPTAPAAATTEKPAAPAVVATEKPAPAPQASQSAPMSPPAAIPAPGESTPMARMPSPEWAAQREQQRAEMMAQYEAMRRAADEWRRQYWDRMRESMPMPMPVMPYGYPVYAPGYVPGVYGPAVR